MSAMTSATEAAKLEASRRDIHHIFLKAQEVAQLCFKELVANFDDEDIFDTQASEANLLSQLAEKDATLEHFGPSANKRHSQEGGGAVDDREREVGEDPKLESKQSEEQSSDLNKASPQISESSQSHTSGSDVITTRTRDFETNLAAVLQLFRGTLVRCPQLHVGIPPLVTAALTCGAHYTGDISIPAFVSKSASYRVTVIGWSSEFSAFAVEHEAHGDIQICLLKLGAVVHTSTESACSSSDEPSISLEIEFSDRETYCAGYLCVGKCPHKEIPSDQKSMPLKAIMHGKVSQMTSVEGGFWEKSDPTHQFLVRLQGTQASWKQKADLEAKACEFLRTVTRSRKIIEYLTLLSSAIPSAITTASPEPNLTTTLEGLSRFLAELYHKMTEGILTRVWNGEMWILWILQRGIMHTFDQLPTDISVAAMMFAERVCWYLRAKSQGFEKVKFETLDEKKAWGAEQSRILNRNGIPMQTFPLFNVFARHVNMLGHALHASADSAISLVTHTFRASHGNNLNNFLKCLERIHDSISFFDKSLRSTERRVPMDMLRKMMRAPGEDAERDCSICLLPCYEQVAKSKVQPASDEKHVAQSLALTEGDRVVFLDCGHSFHFSCAEEWLHRNSTCPNCRSDVFGVE